MRQLDPDSTRAYLHAHGVPVQSIEGIVGAFDFARAVYEQPLNPGQEIFQFVRNPSVGDMSPRLGSWFCMRGASRDDLAIFGGGSGRRLERFVVSHPLDALEGTAAAMSPNWAHSIGGAGGATQIYIPARLLGRLGSAGPHEEW